MRNHPLYWPVHCEHSAYKSTYANSLLFTLSYLFSAYRVHLMLRIWHVTLPSSPVYQFLSLPSPSTDSVAPDSRLSSVEHM